jgi:hypothetical protein
VGHLPGLFLFLVLVVLVVLVFVVLTFAFLVEVVFVFVEVFVGIVKNVTHHEFAGFPRQDTGSVAGFGLAAAWGGYVVQKWRPQALHTQN